METISKNDRTMQLPEGATGEPVYSSFLFLREPLGGHGREPPAPWFCNDKSLSIERPPGNA